MAYKYLVKSLSLLLGIYLAVELLNHMKILCLFFKEPPNFYPLVYSKTKALSPPMCVIGNPTEK